MMIGFDELVSGFRDLGLENGDIVMIHSSYKSFGGVEGGPQTVIDALIEAIGPDGTLIMPTFNFEFCDLYNETGEGYFDLEKTPSEMGILTEFLRKMHGAKRTIHPIYSFAIYGKLVNEFASVDDHTSYGKGTVFAKLHKYNGKIMMIGLTTGKCWTFAHYIEQSVGVDYRYHKKFSGILNVNGKEYKDTYSIYVRDLERGVVTDVEPMGDIMEERGIIKMRKIGDSIVRIMNSAEAYDATIIEMKKNPNVLYFIEK